MPSGEKINLDQQRELAEFRRHVADLREVPVEELIESFEFNDMTELAAYQEHSPVSAFVVQPYSEIFIAKYGESTTMLEDNVTIYNDEFEDALSADPVIQSVVQLRKIQPKDKELASALRARRSTLTAVVAVMAAPVCEVHDIHQNEPDSANSDNDLQNASNM